VTDSDPPLKQLPKLELVPAPATLAQPPVTDENGSLARLKLPAGDQGSEAAGDVAHPPLTVAEAPLAWF
jgi:hypothetical protein